MESTVMGHGDVLLARPVSLMMVCHARRLEWVKSIDSSFRPPLLALVVEPGEEVFGC